MINMVSMSLNKVVLIAVEEEEDFKVLDLIKMICLVTEDLVETLEVLEDKNLALETLRLIEHKIYLRKYLKTILTEVVLVDSEIKIIKNLKIKINKIVKTNDKTSDKTNAVWILLEE